MMPKTIKAWLMFAVSVVVVIAVIKRVPQINQFVGI